MQFLGGVGLRIRNIWLDFGTDPDPESDPNLDPGSIFHQEALVEVWTLWVLSSSLCILLLLPHLLYSLLTPTTVAGVRRSSIRVCDSVILFVCPHVNSKINAPKVFKLGIGNDLGTFQKWYDFWDWKIKGQGHRVTTCKKISKAIEWPAWVMHSIECPASSY